MRALSLSILLASLVSYGLNTAIMQRTGPIARALIAPVIEEVSKTGLSLLLGAVILPVHIGFGIIEGLLEWRPRNHPKRWVLFGCSVFSHSLFGALTVYLYAYTNSPWAAISAAVLLHVFWNAMVLDITRMPKRS